MIEIPDVILLMLVSTLPLIELLGGGFFLTRTPEHSGNQSNVRYVSVGLGYWLGGGGG